MYHQKRIWNRVLVVVKYSKKSYPRQFSQEKILCTYLPFAVLCSYSVISVSRPNVQCLIVNVVKEIWQKLVVWIILSMNIRTITIHITYCLFMALNWIRNKLIRIQKKLTISLRNYNLPPPPWNRACLYMSNNYIMIRILSSRNQTIWCLQNLLLKIGVPLEQFNILRRKFLSITRSSVKRFEVDEQTICSNLKYYYINPLNILKRANYFNGKPKYTKKCCGLHYYITDTFWILFLTFSDFISNSALWKLNFYLIYPKKKS